MSSTPSDVVSRSKARLLKRDWLSTSSSDLSWKSDWKLCWMSSRSDTALGAALIPACRTALDCALDCAAEPRRLLLLLSAPSFICGLRRRGGWPPPPLRARPSTASAIAAGLKAAALQSPTALLCTALL